MSSSNRLLQERITVAQDELEALDTVYDIVIANLRAPTLVGTRVLLC